MAFPHTTRDPEIKWPWAGPFGSMRTYSSSMNRIQNEGGDAKGLFDTRLRADPTRRV